MKNKILFILSTILFTGCDFSAQASYPQQQVCKSLSEGYLRMQNQTTYELWRMEKRDAPEQTRIIKMTYKKPNENGVMLPSQYLPTMELECRLQQQHIVVSVIQATGALVPVLNVQLQNDAIGKPKSPDLIAQSKIQ
ncbi:MULTISPECIES: hypothetical protein [Acinetobacter]|uniref:Lipoprotein n=1 Tax=Acinetobacter vivianii TaxID=1776742 RepID=N9NEN4_9GAMM|nr:MULTISPECIES: hypothetical protein [Acinetobacter]ENX19534.1 hypothetical protein F892_03702 [Acinetobacter vivianii]KYQ83893.1 hypothetical protein AWW72_11995 [Acinetobacter sp. NRRL B-65365]MBJ8482787.1 hypothetical protein [Acinetobacter vivianii]OEC90825.1 hypothetical protein A9Z07_00495 [Acinetobacter sp. YK3]GGI60250.1 hypothetical protein GCM10011446_17450 [Acinetobacter vivianii]